MTFSQQELERMAESVPVWFHSIDFGHGVVTKGWKTPADLAYELNALRLPDLRGKSVLDINAWDGFHSFEAERRGASRVVALDHYMWAMDLAEHHKYWKECKDRGVVPAPYHTMPYYRPDELPGKIGFDTARRALGSSVEAVVGDFMEMDLKPLGAFDVVFYFGSLYHMENPLLALQRVAAVTRGRPSSRRRRRRSAASRTGLSASSSSRASSTATRRTGGHRTRRLWPGCCAPLASAGWRSSSARRCSTRRDAPSCVPPWAARSTNSRRPALRPK